MQAMVPDLYGSWREETRRTLTALLTEITGPDAGTRKQILRSASAWRGLAGLLTIRAFCEDIHVRPLLHITSREAAERIDQRHIQLDAAIAELNGHFDARVAAADERSCRNASRRLYTRLAALVAGHMADRTEERRAMSRLAVQFDPLALLAAERALRASLDGERALAGIDVDHLPPAEPALNDVAFFARVGQVLAAAARRPHARETARIRPAA